MKNSLLALGFIALVGCGSQNDSALRGEPMLPSQSEDARVLNSLNNGKIVNVENFTIPFSAPNGALGGLPQTKITLDYVVNCWEKLETFSYTTEEKEGKLIVYTNALVSYEKNVQALCQAFANVEKSFTVEGAYSKESITLVQLEAGNPVDLAAGITKVAPAKSLKVVGTQPLCPPNARCITNGTIVQLEIEKGFCTENIATVSYVATMTDAGADLVIAATTAKNPLRVKCVPGPWTDKAEVTLVGISVDKENLKLIEVK